MKCIIVDDEVECINSLKKLLALRHHDAEVIGEAASVKAALVLLKEHKDTDLVFLDIQMPVENGFELLRQLDDIHFKVIFTTAYDQYAIKAIKFSALDYLLKPINSDELSATLDRYRLLHADKNQRASIKEFKTALHQKKLFDRLAVPTLTEIKLIDLDKIVYLESDNSYTTFYMDDRQSLIVSKSIGYYEDLLETNFFFRIHNSYLVNLKRVDSYVKGKGGAVRLDNGTELEVSVRRKDELLKLLSNLH